MRGEKTTEGRKEWAECTKRDGGGDQSNTQSLTEETCLENDYKFRRQIRALFKRPWRHSRHKGLMGGRQCWPHTTTITTISWSRVGLLTHSSIKPYVRIHWEAAPYLVVAQCKPSSSTLCPFPGGFLVQPLRWSVASYPKHWLGERKSFFSVLISWPNEIRSWLKYESVYLQEQFDRYWTLWL